MSTPQDCLQSTDVKKNYRAMQICALGNEAILRAKDEEELLHSLCRVTVQEGGHKFAYVGYVGDDAGEMVELQGVFGENDSFLENIRLSWGSDEWGRGVTGMAISTGKISLIKDLLQDKRAERWKEDARRYGFGSSIGLPLFEDGRVFGALTIVSADVDGFDEQEVQLLERLAVNLGYGIQALRSKAIYQEAEKKTREREEFFNTVLESIPEGIVVCESNGVITYANRRMVEIATPVEDELLGSKCVEMFGEDNRQIMIHQKKDRAKGVISKYDLEVDPKTFAIHAIPLTGEDGRFVGSVGVVSDITEMKRMQEKATKLASVVENSGDLIGLADTKGMTTYLNPFGRKLLGIEPESSLEGVHVSQLTPRDGCEPMRSQVLADGQWRGEFELLHQGTGEPVYVEMHAFVIRDEHTGEPIALANISRDNRERLEVERDHTRLLTVLEESPNMVSTANLEGGDVYINRFGRKLLGIDLDADLTGLSIFDFVPEDRRENAKQQIYTTLFEEGVWRKEFPLCHYGTGEPIPFEMHAFLITDPKTGEPMYIANVARDLREQKGSEEERKRLQADLLQVQKMESIGQLVGGMAHDFNNILSVVMTNAGMLKYSMQVEDERLKFVRQILSSADRGAEMIRRLMTFSRKQPMKLETFDLCEYIEKLVPFIARLVGERVEIETHLKTCPNFIRADRLHIEQILMNLATNARDAMPNGGKLILSTETVAHQQFPGGIMECGLVGCDCVRVSVQDTGCGMDDAVIEKAFDPFFTTKEVGKGTGLGLSTVYGLVQQNDAKILFESQPGEGTTARICFPAAPVPEHETREKQEASTGLSHGSETILLVEDEEEVRETGRTVLESLGYTVHEAYDGVDAVEKLQSLHDKIDLVILDVVMPRMSGKEVFDRVRELNPGMKVLFTSGYTADIVDLDNLPDSGVAFVAKPMSVDQLLLAVRGVLDN